MCYNAVLLTDDAPSSSAAIWPLIAAMSFETGKLAVWPVDSTGSCSFSALHAR
jgi:hypothetical protein